MNVKTVQFHARTHYAHVENGRTLCGLLGGRSAGGPAECGRCEQILHGVDTRYVRK